jgi:uncharacterized protein YggE
MVLRSLKRLLLIAAVTIGALGAANAQNSARPTISTTGEGVARAAPDFAMVTIGVQTQSKTAQSALAENSKATSAVIDALKGVGVAAKDIQTSEFSVWPQNVEQPSRGSGAPQGVAGYIVANRVTATVRDVSRLGETLDKTVASGANAINGVEFGVDDASHLLDEARKTAFADAKRKAEIYAAEAGAKLGPLVSLEETGANAPVAGGMMKEMAAAPRPPIEAGEMKLSVQINAQFEIAR